MKKLNLGCGTDHRKGWVNLDFSELGLAEVKHDMLKFPYPFKDNEFDYILASHVLEHFYYEEITKIMNEIHRIIKKSGTLEIRVPYYNSPCNFEVIDHKTKFSFQSFRPFYKGKGYHSSLDKKEWEIIETKATPTTIGRLIPNFTIHKFRKINAIGQLDERNITLRQMVSFSIGNIYSELRFKFRKWQS